MSVFEQCYSCKDYDHSNQFCHLENPQDSNLCPSYRPTLNNSKGMFRTPLLGRIRRTEFWLTQLLFIALWLLSQWLLDQHGTPMIHALIFFFILIICIISIPVCIIQGIKRCHDRGHSGWWILLPFFSPLGVLLLLNPLCSPLLLVSSKIIGGWWALLFNPLGLLFLSGEKGINQYGTDPKQSYESQMFSFEQYEKEKMTTMMSESTSEVGSQNRDMKE